jgi:DNA-binding response OmpR family regulator
MIKAHLLLVDSDPLSLGTLVDTFRAEPGISFHAAKNLEEARNILRDPAAAFDLMVLDCLMPGRGGLDPLHRLRADPRLAVIPIILQTPLPPTADQMRKGAAIGAYHYLTMPCNHDAVVSIVHAALAKSSFRNALRRQLRSRAGSAQSLDACEFAVRTLEEAGELATLVAQACPNSEATLFGISELLVNGVEHGNLDLPYGEKSQLALNNCWKSEVDRRSANPDNLGKRVRLSFRRESHQITLRIADEGRGFAWRNCLELDPRRASDPNGRGIALSRMLSFSSINYEGCGNVAVATIAPLNCQ